MALVLVAAAVALVRFGQGFARLRRRGRRDHAGWDRAVLFVAGLAAATLPLVTSFDEVADRDLISAHMLQHVLIGDVAPALMLVALRGPLLAFVLPAPFGRVVARLDALPAWVVVCVWAAAIGAWHVPAAYDAALAHPLVHDAEHASFVAAGFLLWSKLLDPARRGRLSVGQRLALAGTVFALGQVLADTLFLAGPLYPAYAAVPHRLLGLTPAADQQLAGLVMMAEQTLTLGVLAAFLLWPAGRVRRSAPRALRLPATS